MNGGVDGYWTGSFTLSDFAVLGTKKKKKSELLWLRTAKSGQSSDIAPWIIILGRYLLLPYIINLVPHSYTHTPR